MTPFQKTLTNWCITNIKTFPEDWEISSYHATHRKKGLKIWYTSGPEFINIEHYGTKVVGDEEMHMLGWLIPWRRRLYLAIANVRKFEQQEAQNIANAKAKVQLEKEIGL